MLPHEERVVEEKRDLDVKLVKLVQFITSPMPSTFMMLEAVDRILLLEQRAAMARYSDILADRIGRFLA